MVIFLKKKKKVVKKNGLIQKDKEKSIHKAELKEINKLARTTNDLVRAQLTGPAKLIGDKELDLMIKMDTPLQNIQTIMRNRTIVAGALLFFFLFLSIFIAKYRLFLILFGVLIAGVSWFMNIKNTNNYYARFRLARQVAFSQFTRLASAYLPELKSGVNLYSLFSKILPRMNNEKDKVALERLMIDMQIDPNDSTPFLDFAHSFSTSDRAELIMLSIQQMYLGDVDDDNIRSLAEDANEDMIAQIDEVIKYKTKKFNNLTTKISMCVMIVIFGFFGLLLYKTFVDAFGQAGANIGG